MKRNIELDKLRYPIGRFVVPDQIDENRLAAWIRSIEQFPVLLRKELDGLKDEELEKTYRSAGWTIRQLVHHCADSHMNSFIRFKLALTEDSPIIKPYMEGDWAELNDAKNFSIDSSIQILEGVHRRWVYLLSSLDQEMLDRTFVHPDGNQRIDLKTNIGIYAWHGEHHLMHIRIAKES